MSQVVASVTVMAQNDVFLLTIKPWNMGVKPVPVWHWYGNVFVWSFKQYDLQTMQYNSVLPQLENLERGQRHHVLLGVRYLQDDDDDVVR